MDPDFIFDGFCLLFTGRLASSLLLSSATGFVKERFP